MFPSSSRIELAGRLSPSCFRPMRQGIDPGFGLAKVRDVRDGVGVETCAIQLAV